MLVSVIMPKLKTDGGIHLVDNHNWQDDRRQYRVLAIGPKVKEIVPGDHVLCPLYVGNPIILEDGTQRWIMDAGQAIAVWKTPNSFDPAKWEMDPLGPEPIKNHKNG